MATVAGNNTSENPEQCKNQTVSGVPITAERRDLEFDAKNA